MPPAAVKTIRDLIFWQYAKIIAASAGMGKSNYRFIMDRYKKLRSGEIEWSSSIREYVKERERLDECIYCGAKGNLSVDHLIPLSRGGPDTPDNAVMACRSCNSSKGSRGVYEWYGLEGRDHLPRVVEGKYLKLLYRLHDERGSLDVGRADLERLCNECEISHLCEESVLTVYCLESILRKRR
ncbi:MAG: HNH endonuclease [Thermoplasmata archaeon]|nr:MAG: HNH endonuclease [Thermoplasmata archaeon]